MELAYREPQTGSSRVVGLAVVIVMHIGLAYLLASGLGKSMIEVLKAPIETKVLEELRNEEAPPPPPPPDFDEPPPPFVPPPDITLDLPPAAPSASAITTQSKVATPAPARTANIVAPRSDPRRPVTQPEYPASSQRLGEEGRVVVKCLVDPQSGRCQDAQLDVSSGFPRLDEAAVREAKRAWRFLPGSNDGKPVAMWHSVAVKFEIKK